MERKMRRFRQMLPLGESLSILGSATHGVLSLVGPGNIPYGVPLSFVFDGGRHIYFHCAPVGYKMDCLGNNPRCSFCIVAQDDVVPEEFTTYFRSVIVGGKVSVVSDSDEVIFALRLLSEKYSPSVNPGDEIRRSIGHVAVLRLDIEDITGKEAVELVRKRDL